jgi:hypothetical protein
MASQFDLLFATSAAPSLLALHGESITRVGNGEPVTAIVTVEPPDRTEERGDGRIFRPKIQVADSVTVSLYERWIINGVEYGTENIAPVCNDGLREIELVLGDPQTRGPR